MPTPQAVTLPTTAPRRTPGRPTYRCRLATPEELREVAAECSRGGLVAEANHLEKLAEKYERMGAGDRARMNDSLR
jgi:hypothetical protein